MAATGVDRSTGGWHQGMGQQQSTPLAPPPASVVDPPWRLILSNGGDHVDDGPKPHFRTSDFAHVALAETTEDRWQSNPASIVAPVRGDKAAQQLGSNIFPYLQLHPPHCRSCTC